MAYSGRFQPKNPKKYRGDPTQIIFRSLWERRCMTMFDLQDSILEWTSEELCLPYRDPVDGRPRRYFPDFVITTKTKDGTIKTIMIEVKPNAQQFPPKPPPSGRVTPRFLREAYAYGVNQAKWATAKAYCASKGWEWAVWTEKDLPFI